MKHSEHMRPMRNFRGETSLLRPECCSFLMAWIWQGVPTKARSAILRLAASLRARRLGE